MGDKLWVQCAKCGRLHQVKKKYIEDSDDLYISAYCERCRDGTHHLLIGEHREDIYIYGDPYLDERYF